MQANEIIRLLRERNPGRSVPDLVKAGQWEFLWAIYEMFFISTNPELTVLINVNDDYLLKIAPISVIEPATRKEIIKGEYAWGILQGQLARAMFQDKLWLYAWNFCTFLEDLIATSVLGGWAEMKKIQLFNKTAFDDEEVLNALGIDAFNDLTHQSIQNARTWAKVKRHAIEEAYRIGSEVALLDICSTSGEEMCPLFQYGPLFESFLREPPSFFSKDNWLIDSQSIALTHTENDDLSPISNQLLAYFESLPLGKKVTRKEAEIGAWGKLKQNRQSFGNSKSEINDHPECGNIDTEGHTYFYRPIS